MLSFKKLQLLLKESTISDLQTKMKFIRKIPQDSQTRLFFDMCNFGINLYLQTEQERFPSKTRKQIMREYYLSRRNKR
ncbi:MAG: hypothetical protein JW776_12060 [Candidatus Lokiarchaeota archaeon]|nr:hypothetical protein [Candidatus Lokiarchaeota archaeon]